MSNKSFHGKEVFQRLNYLYQASHLMLILKSSPQDMPAYYGKQLTSIAKKSVLRMEPAIKRGICKGCKTVLVPGVSAKVRIRPKLVIWTCLRCRTLKRFPTKIGYKSWSENPQSCMEVWSVPDTTNTISKCNKSKNIPKEEELNSR